MASITGDGFMPFAQFMESVHAARAEQYLNLPHSTILDENAFDEMRAYVLRYYDGVAPTWSFADAGGSVFDCIPIEQQMSLRGQTGSPAAPPDPPTGRRGASNKPSSQAGNEVRAPPGTIPVRRLTLEDLSRFPTLGHFLRKVPSPA
jgi:hypothetical protein